MPIKREIIYPVFLSCIPYAKNSFWENIFEELVYGKPPNGTFINKGFLCCSYKNKEFSYKIDTNIDPEKLYEDIYDLLTNKLNILSINEKNKKKLQFLEIEKNIKDNFSDWKLIKKKNIKDLLIEKYALDMGKKFSLSKQQIKHLLTIIFLALVFKMINSKDIVYTNNKIQSIEGFEFSHKKFKYCKDIYKDRDNTITYFGDNTVRSKKKLQDNWEKYLNNII